MTQNVHHDSAGAGPQGPPLWPGRPRRSRGDRKVAGVAGGLGRAFGIDPVLIRVAFVVLAIFGGFGVLLYAIGWLLLPADGDQVSAAEALVGRGHSSVSPALAVVLIIVALGSAGSIFSWGLPFWPVVVGAVIIALVAHKRRWAGSGGGARGDCAQRGQQFADRAAQWGSRAPWGYRAPGSRGPWGSSWTGGNAGSGDSSPFDRPAFWDAGDAARWQPPAPGSRVGGTPPAAPGADSTSDMDRGNGRPSDETATVATSAPGVTAADSLTDSPAGPPSPADLLAGARRTPPAWDPLGAAPFAWDLPDPTPLTVEPQVARRRSALTRVVLGLALVTGAVCAAGAASGQWSLSWAQVSGITLAVVAVGLLIGSLRGTGRRLIGHGVFLSLLTIALTVTGISGTDGYGQQTWTPTAADVAAGEQLNYSLNAGDGVLDLRQLSVAAGHSVVADLEVKAGQATVIVPEGVTVEASCSARLGQVDCLGKSADGVLPAVSADQAGSTEAGTVIVKVHTNTGHVEVRNG